MEMTWTVEVARRILVVLPLLAVWSPAHADDWPAAQEKTYESPNHLYHARIIPGNSFGDVWGFESAPKGSYAQAVLTGPGAPPSQTFTLLNPIAPVEAALLDDGSLLTVDNWHNAGYGAVVVLYTPQGNVQWRHELESLLPPEKLKLVPGSASSRWWRKSPLEWKPAHAADGAPAIALTLWSEDRMRFRLADGAVEYVPVDDPGDDPQRLLKRAEALATEASWTHSYEKAIAAFKRVIALDPHAVEAYRGLARAYTRRHDLPNAIAALQEGIRQNPISGSVTSESGWQSDPRMWLRLELAWAYGEADRSQEAEDLLHECLRLDPAFWEAGKTLAKLWMAAGRREEADALLAKFFESKKGAEGHWHYSHNLSKASYDVGGVYEEFKDDQQAKAYYLKAYGQGELDQFLYQRLADVHERLGEPDEALKVLEPLKAWMQQQPGYEDQVKRLEDRIARLRSRP